MSYETLDLDSIKMENPYLRIGTDVSTLEKSIGTVGLIAPLIVNQDNILLAGARRWQALKNLGHTSAPVIRVDKDSLQQELISIDENLVRKSLSNPEMEAHLLRAKEIYLNLAHEDSDFKDTLMKKRQSRIDAGEDNTSEDQSTELGVEELVVSEFAKEVSEKSGLSSSQVLKAMEREEKSSDELRQARNEGQVSVSQANEVIRLEHADQAKILPHIEGRTVSELRKLVKKAKTDGVEEALLSHEQLPHAREFRDMIKFFKKTLKISQTLELEGIVAEGKFKSDLEKIWPEIVKNMDSIIETDSSHYLGSHSEHSFEQESSFN